MSLMSWILLVGSTDSLHPLHQKVLASLKGQVTVRGMDVVHYYIKADPT